MQGLIEERLLLEKEERNLPRDDSKCDDETDDLPAYDVSMSRSQAGNICSEKDDVAGNCRTQRRKCKRGRGEEYSCSGFRAVRSVEDAVQKVVRVPVCFTVRVHNC